MSVLDAYALIAFLLGEPPGEEVKTILRETRAQIASVNLAETYDRAIRLKAIPIDDLDHVIDDLVTERSLTILGLDHALARRAGQLRAEYYDRNERRVSMADCIAAATTERLRDTLVTADAHLVRLAQQIEVDVIPLPDSSGRRP